MQHFIKIAYYIEKTLEKWQNDAFLTKKSKKSKKSRKKVKKSVDNPKWKWYISNAFTKKGCKREKKFFENWAKTSILKPENNKRNKT